MVRIEPPRRVTVKQNIKFVNVMSFIYHPLLVRVDNQSDYYSIELCDKEIKPGAIGKDSRNYSFKVPKKASVLLPYLFEGNELWAYSPDGDVELRVMFADSTDMVTIAKLTAGIGSGGTGAAASGGGDYGAPVDSSITVDPTELIEWTP
jgi:hypothetical protein